MISERLLTRFLRFEIKRYLSLSPANTTMLPRPNYDHAYLLYAHVPFCERLCPYCSFNRFPFQEELARAYFKRLREEMRMVADLGYTFPSMYIGGGTPTIMIDELVQTIDLGRELFGFTEVSCETNPNHLTPQIVGQLEGRVQRLSVGIQSFDDELLREMQRYEKYGSGEDILRGLESIAGLFPTLNADMIFNFPSQTSETLRADIQKVIDSSVSQTTFYALMTSPSVKKSMKNTVGKVDYTREAEYYQTLCSELGKAFNPVSAWCFSRRGDDMIDEYIVDYEEYVGVGSGAFSYLDGALYVNTFSLQKFNESISAGHMSVSQVRRFKQSEQMRYRFMMELFGLKLSKQRFQESFGVSIERGLWLEMAFMKLADAFDINDANTLTLTAKGRYLMVVMMREFFSNLNDVRDQARSALSSEELADLLGTCPDSPD
ncbi:MAG: coproporphyrinogen III oxidase family protein [Chloroflexota bacterium]|nr:coproporphyrinogen III oxidase family protein [Chloroflexota bacterium]